MNSNPPDKPQFKAHPRSRPGYRPLLRGAAWVVLLVFFVSCTRQVPRAPLETRRFAVDWNGLDARRIEAAGLTIDGVVLTPAQWPLEASVKKLLQGDFVGVFEHLDLSFRPATLREDVLERLFDEGFVPAYLRVRNPGGKAALFDPSMVVVRADQKVALYPFPSERLPRRFQEIDWAEMGMGVVVVAMMVVLVAAGNRQRSYRPRRSAGRVQTSVYVNVWGDGSGRRRSTGRRGIRESARDGRGLLRAKTLQPGESLEGFLFFQLDETVADWTTARIARP